MHEHRGDQRQKNWSWSWVVLDREIPGHVVRPIVVGATIDNTHFAVDGSLQIMKLGNFERHQAETVGEPIADSHLSRKYDDVDDYQPRRYPRKAAVIVSLVADNEQVASPGRTVRRWALKIRS